MRFGTRTVLRKADVWGTLAGVFLTCERGERRSFLYVTGLQRATRASEMKDTVASSHDNMTEVDELLARLSAVTKRIKAAKQEENEVVTRLQERKEVVCSEYGRREAAIIEEREKLDAELEAIQTVRVGAADLSAYRNSLYDVDAEKEKDRRLDGRPHDTQTNKRRADGGSNHDDANQLGGLTTATLVRAMHRRNDRSRRFVVKELRAHIKPIRARWNNAPRQLFTTFRLRRHQIPRDSRTRG